MHEVSRNVRHDVVEHADALPVRPTSTCPGRHQGGVTRLLVVVVLGRRGAGAAIFNNVAHGIACVGDVEGRRLPAWGGGGGVPVGYGPDCAVKPALTQACPAERRFRTLICNVAYIKGLWGSSAFKMGGVARCLSGQGAMGQWTGLAHRGRTGCSGGKWKEKEFLNQLRFTGRSAVPCTHSARHVEIPPGVGPAETGREGRGPLRPNAHPLADGRLK